jgi:hypothetical protein
MTVGELIKQLQEYDESFEVVIHDEDYFHEVDFVSLRNDSQVLLH